jgi:hypothetical protein
VIRGNTTATRGAGWTGMTGSVVRVPVTGARG